MVVPARCRFAAVLSAVVLGAACAAPPTKELSLAEGAIAAARAAGAAQYATADLTAAEERLARAQADVAARDYRAALGHALEANSQAQTAARAAADGRVKARLAADDTLDGFAVRIEQVETQLASDEAKRVPAAARRRAAGQVAAALDLLAATRAAVERGDFASLEATRQATTALDAALAAITPPPAKRPRAPR